ncbi:MAG: PTS sugar transporter subunit IIC [Leuconostoc pseudomesenteroides]|uniref:PTS sugar transporter subunit IIC n=1 Tax=Leuconostoc pseudomesenteroides TaxID=33968 RepID=UPI0039EB42F1
MQRITDWLQKNLVPIGAKLSSIKALNAIRDGIALAMPLILVGSLAMIIRNFPTPNDMWVTWITANGVLNWLVKIIYGTFYLVGIVSVVGIAANYAKLLSPKADGISAGVLALGGYFVSTPYLNGANGNQAWGAKVAIADQGIAYSATNANGMFAAIIIGLVSAAIYAWFLNHNITIKMPDSVPPAVGHSFAALIPGFVIILLWALLYALFQATGLVSIHNILQMILGDPLKAFGGSLIGAIVVAVLVSLFWFIGIHGGNLVGAIMSPIFLQLMQENVDAAKAGKALPEVITQPFMDNFVYIGGGGATLGLIIALAIFAKSKQNKAMRPLTLVPGIFNINEPTMFGLPVVLNVYLIVPFLIVPVMNVLISYFAMSSGLVARTTGTPVPWTMPPVISGFLATSSISGAVLQIVLILLDLLIWIPFFKVFDKALLDEEKQADNDAVVG